MNTPCLSSCQVCEESLKRFDERCKSLEISLKNYDERYKQLQESLEIFLKNSRKSRSFQNENRSFQNENNSFQRTCIQTGIIFSITVLSIIYLQKIFMEIALYELTWSHRVVKLS